MSITTETRAKIIGLIATARMVLTTHPVWAFFLRETGGIQLDLDTHAG